MSVVVLFAQAPLVSAGYVIAPADRAGAEGTISNCYPFGIDIGDSAINQNPLTSQRYQQAYAASLFAGHDGPLTITRISFRPDAVSGGAFSATLADIQINLSTTPRVLSELTGVFADNLGSDDSIVVGRGSLALSSGFTGPADGPKDFDIHIDLTTPFTYDPGAGNLLLDVRNFGGVAGDAPAQMVFDAEWFTSDIWRAWTTNPDVDGVGSLETSYFGESGLVTLFTFTESDGSACVPAPGAILLALIVAGLVGRFRRRGIV
jgi:hypothetical protein